MAFSDIPVGVGVIYEGERIRAADTHLEFGGPNAAYKFELLQMKPLEEIVDGKIEIIGPDIKELAEGGSYPIAILIEVAGKELEKELESVLEREVHKYINYIEGMFHLASRHTIWIRLSKSSFKRGLNSLKYVGVVLQRLFKAEFPIVERIQTTFITDEAKVKEHLEKAMKVYEERDARVRGMRDEDVEEFYGCTLCQSFAPTHVCIITPERPSLCGSISWLDARTAVRINPKGHNFKVEKGDCLDPVKGEYSGVNRIAAEKSLGSINRVNLYTIFDSPHTSCGCFEALAFYIPEVDGIGIVHRGFKGSTVNGLPFSTMAGQASGGRQIVGLVGISIQYMKSPRFVQADGGWSRVVWVPSEVKEKVKDMIPSELYDKIATEKDVKTIEELETFLRQKGHPVMARIEEVSAECPVCGKVFTVRLPVPEKVTCPHCGALLERE